MQVTEPCKIECKFCIIHEYGVYIVSSVGIFMLVLILIVYRKEVFDYCCGQEKPVTDSPQDTAPESPQPQVIVSESTANYNSPPPVEPIMTGPSRVQQPVIYQQPIVSPPRNQTTLSTIKKQPVDNDYYGVKTERPKIKQTNSPTKAGPVVKLPNKMPNPTRHLSNPPTQAQSRAVAPYESTGSNYYKQMIRGKRPVASISQYLVRKPKKAEPQATETENKRNPHHRTKKR